MAATSLTAASLVDVSVGLPRRPSELVRASGRFSWMRFVALSIVMLNLLDAVLTLVWVNLGVAEEANVLLAYVLDHSAVAFVVVKMGLVSSGLALLWSQRQHKLATIGLLLAFVTYNALLLYHFYVAAVTVEYFS